MIEYMQSLIEVLNTMGARHSNPVMEVIGFDKTVQLEKKYPATSGYLGNETWRAFYHCHDTEDKPDNEHGHFHVFINVENDNDSSHWPHLVGLSMDTMGQPIQWFTVNQWVTSGNWIASEQLTTGILNCSIDDNMAQVEKWLVCMMNIYLEEISQLLLDRDATLSRYDLQSGRKNILQERGIYTLSTQAANLQNKLETLILKQSG